MRLRGVLREEVVCYAPRALAQWRRRRRVGYPKGPRFAYTRDRRSGAHHFGEAVVAAALGAGGDECWAGSYRLFRPAGRSSKDPQSAEIRRLLLDDDLPDPRALPSRVRFTLKDPAVVSRNAASRRWTFCEVVRDRSEFDETRLCTLWLLRAVYGARVRVVRVVPDGWPALPPTEHVMDLELDAAGLWWTGGPVASDAEHFELSFGSMVSDELIVPVARVARRKVEGGAPFVVDLLPVRGHDVRWLTRARAAAMADLEAYLLGARDDTGWHRARARCDSGEDFSALIHWTYHPAGSGKEAGPASP